MSLRSIDARRRLIRDVASKMTRFLLPLFCLLIFGCDQSVDYQLSSDKPTGGREEIIGQFEVDSEFLIVADPSYDLDTVRRGHGVEKAAQNGTWTAKVTLREFGDPNSTSVGRLVVHHSTVSDWTQLDWVEEEYALGVDTGQMAVSDKDTFQDPLIVPENQKFTFGDNRDEPAIAEMMWYSYCCELTMGSAGGVFEGGAVSNAGWGDGGYAGYHALNKRGELIGFRVEFIDEDGN